MTPQYNQNVMTLEDFDFNGSVLIPSQQNPNFVFIVKCSAPWCGPCKANIEPFKAAAASLSPTENIFFINVFGDATGLDLNDATTFTQGAKNLISSMKTAPFFQIKGFPTILKFRGGKVVDTYSGNRSTGDLLRFARSS